MKDLLALQSATLAARARTGDQSIGTNAEQGQIRVVRVTSDTTGNWTVSDLSDPLPATKAVEFLNAL